ncbi:MAG TPA: LptF/LptG family permease [Saprospiraceae bacterium]|nr:LptF/LptG family permease [Saprospiraceae bacterium]
MLRRLDKLLVSSFIPPFIVAFFIAVFVLMMQFVWVYIDDIIGKGVDLFTIIELLGYLSVSRVPMALPIGVLIASVMVMGNLSEKYELSSFKSAGISLLRVMRPLMVVMLGIALFSYVCSNYLIPKANLKFGSRLYDIRRQKPALSMEEGVFNDDFQDFVMRIKSKKSDNKTIEDVLIYNQTNNYDNINEIVAKSGKMFTTPDKQYLVMQLSDGTQYQELENSSRNNEKFPFVRTSFKSWQKIYDLKEFEMNKTDENLFKSHQMMLSSYELLEKIDSINKKVAQRIEVSGDIFKRFFHVLKISSKDSLKVGTENTALKPLNINKFKYQEPLQQTNTNLSSIHSFIETIVPNQRETLLTRARAGARSVESEITSLSSSVERSTHAKYLHQYELHLKISIAIICLVFLFVGAPMGAIVRKGGFGYPLLISIIYFMIFIVLNILCKNLADENVINGITAAWAPVLVLSPIGIILTYKALRDTSFINTDRYYQFFKKIFQFISRKKKVKLKESS